VRNILRFKLFESDSNKEILSLVEDLYLDMIDDGIASVDTEYLYDAESNNISIVLYTDLESINALDNFDEYITAKKEFDILIDKFYSKYKKLKEKFTNCNFTIRGNGTDEFEILMEVDPIVSEYYILTTATKNGEKLETIRFDLKKLKKYLFSDFVRNLLFCNFSMNEYESSNGKRINFLFTGFNLNSEQKQSIIDKIMTLEIEGINLVLDKKDISYNYTEKGMQTTFTIKVNPALSDYKFNR